jgi:RHS repeat-associated protein
MELLNYFYHPDHASTRLSTGLGSSSWITDNTGRPIQHLHYLPFGEDWVDQRNSSWNAPYTFSGKEKDVETGYGYFGARYYDSGLSIWLSVDPMSDKYPSMSPYNYCANNPVILVDPDGREINLYGIKYEQGQNYKGDNKLVAAAWNMVNDINNTRLGNIIISALCSSSKTYDIRLDSKSGGEYNPKNHKISMQNSFTQLIHELFHAYLDDSGHGQQTTYNEVGARLCAFYIYNNYIDNLSKGLTNEIYSSTDQLATQLPSAIFDNNILQLKKQFNNQSFDYVAKNFKKHFTGYSNISSETSDTQKNFVINFFKKN